MLKKTIAIFSLFLFLSLIQLYLMTAFSDSFFSIEIIFSILITAMGVLIGLAILFQIKKNKRSAFLPAIILVSFILAHLIGILGARYQSSKRRESADLIIEKIDAFHKKNNRYPEDLNQLIPEFFDEIPKSIWGLKEFDYEYKLYKKNKSFSLEYKSGNSSGWSYYHGDGWQFYE